jgi:hypothetical protein
MNEQWFELSPPNPRLVPCAEINPRLWLAYCRITGRDPMPSPYWTEADVVVALDARFGLVWPDEKELDSST